MKGNVDKMEFIKNKQANKQKRTSALCNRENEKTRHGLGKILQNTYLIKNSHPKYRKKLKTQQ